MIATGEAVAGGSIGLALLTYPSPLESVWCIIRYCRLWVGCDRRHSHPGNNVSSVWSPDAIKDRGWGLKPMTNTRIGAITFVLFRMIFFPVSLIGAVELLRMAVMAANV